MIRRTLCLLALVGLAGCGEGVLVLDEDSGVTAPVDAATPDAASVPPDAGALPSVDAAIPDDAGTVDAAGEAPDVGAAPSDAAAAPPDAASPDVGAAGAVQYPADRSLSPIGPETAERLRSVVARGTGLAPDVFAKVGASNTVNTNFLHCFAGANVDLAGRDELAPTVAFFKGGDAAGTTPYNRTSLAATVGWSAWSAIAGSPSPLEKEVSAISPQLAVVLFGTNDIQARDLFKYEGNILDITDQLLARGIVPLLTSVSPRDDDAAADLWVPRYSAVVRAIAQARGVPFLDLERELRQLSDHGIGADGLHLTTYLSGGAARGCFFTDAALKYGFNRRNLLTLQTLHRVRGVLSGGAAPDPSPPRLQGAGTAADPFEIGALPFGDLRDTSRSGERLIDKYTGCSAAQDEGGRELYYRLDLAAPATVRAMVFARNGVDVDLHLLQAQPTAGACRARDDKLLVQSLTAGTWYFALDTYVSGGAERAGEYLFVVVKD